MSYLGKTIFVAAVLCCMLIGCNEDQLQRTDRLVSDINNVAAGGGAVLESPAGDLLPDPIKQFAILAVLLASGGVNLYQKWRTAGLANKYTSMKSGQAQFKIENPDAEKQLYALIGSERAARGL